MKATTARPTRPPITYRVVLPSASGSLETRVVADRDSLKLNMFSLGPEPLLLLGTDLT